MRSTAGRREASCDWARGTGEHEQTREAATSEDTSPPPRYWHSTEVEEMEALYTEIRARLEALIEKTEEYNETDDPTPPRRRGPRKN